MTAHHPMDRTDAGGLLPRWLTLVVASLATLVAIGVLWSLAGTAACASGADVPLSDGILPGPQPCADGQGPALTTAGILLALLAGMFVVAFTVERRRGLVLLILAGAMLLVLIVGLMATVALATQPVIYY